MSKKRQEVKYTDLLKVMEEVYRHVGYNEGVGLDELANEIYHYHKNDTIDLSKFIDARKGENESDGI